MKKKNKKVDPPIYGIHKEENILKASKSKLSKKDKELQARYNKLKNK